MRTFDETQTARWRGIGRHRRVCGSRGLPPPECEGIVELVGRIYPADRPPSVGAIVGHCRRCNHLLILTRTEIIADVAIGDLPCPGDRHPLDVVPADDAAVGFDCGAD